MALAACAGQTVVPILRRMHQPIEGCTVEASGQRRDEHPTLLTDIHLTFTLRGPALDPTVVARAISLAETEYCPVWAMLEGGTRITSCFEIAGSGQPLAT